ncbi:MAG: hypothetical protein ABH842_04410 [Candidatus Micrarchaeota archaeon]
MANPVLKKPKKKAPADIVIPRISEQETRKRAAAGFDIAVTRLVKEEFSRSPPASEMAAFKKLFLAKQKSDGEFFVDDVVQEFIENNPDSVIERYYNLAGNARFLLKGNQVAFNLKELQGAVKTYMSPLRDSVISSIVKLSDPENRGVSFSIPDMDAGILSSFSSRLSTIYGIGKTQVPVEIKCSGMKLTFNSKLPPPTQSFDFDK